MPKEDHKSLDEENEEEATILNCCNCFKKYMHRLYFSRKRKINLHNVYKFNRLYHLADKLIQSKQMPHDLPHHKIDLRWGSILWIRSVKKQSWPKIQIEDSISLL
jgi:hypothetical protein